MKKSLVEIRTLYVKRYPHLDHLTDWQAFAKAALQLAAPDGISGEDTTTLTMVANGMLIGLINIGLYDVNKP